MNDEKMRIQKLADLITDSGFTLEEAKKAVANLEKKENKRKEKKPVLTEDQKLDKAISRVCHKLKIPGNLYGYKMFKNVIKIVVENPSVENALGKEVFKRIADENSTQLVSVIKPIEHVITIAFEKGNQEELNELFDRSVGQPSDSEFIKKVAEKVREELQK